MRTITVAALALLLAAALLPSQAVAAQKTYTPPFALGPAGGDEYNIVYRDEGSGRIAIGRGFPGVPPVVGCVPEPGAGWATFRVPIPAGTKIRTVALKVDSMLDPYSWVTLGVRTGRGWLGSTKLQGPVGGEQTLRLSLDRAPRPRERITVEFGLQLGDACPQVGGAVATFASVTVRS